MGKLDFVAVDFETATNDRMACQVGLVVVRNGCVVEKREILICPPDNRFDTVTMRVHGITPAMTKECATFDKVWEDIAHYFENSTVVAHNAAFDQDVLMRNLDYYGITPDRIGGFVCTYEIYGRSLKDLCEVFQIDCSGHHDALFDAECCAEFYRAYLVGGDMGDILRNAPKLKFRSREPMDKTGFHTRITGDVLKKDLSNADPNNPFYDKKVVITGVFGIISRQDIALRLKNMGADVDTGITKRTNIVVVGEDAGPKKLEKIEKLALEGIDIRIINEEELHEIFINFPVRVDGSY